eukprot:m.419604 g.419604  ORF g.419604 m.419604 type:complete len:183 (+) comp16840_c1_seq27:271-819(+)
MSPHAGWPAEGERTSFEAPAFHQFSYLHLSCSKTSPTPTHRTRFSSFNTFELVLFFAHQTLAYAIVDISVLRVHSRPNNVHMSANMLNFLAAKRLSVLFDLFQSVHVSSSRHRVHTACPIVQREFVSKVTIRANGNVDPKVGQPKDRSVTAAVQHNLGHVLLLQLGDRPALDAQQPNPPSWI